MRVADFFRERARLERLESRGAYSGDVFHAPERILVRWETEAEVTQDASGREVVTTAHVSTLTPLGDGDRLTHEDGRAGRVVRVSPNRDTRGRLSHYVAHLRSGA